MAWGPIHQYVFVLKLCKCYEFTSLYEPALSLPRCECVLGMCVCLCIFGNPVSMVISTSGLYFFVCVVLLCVAASFSPSVTLIEQWSSVIPPFRSRKEFRIQNFRKRKNSPRKHCILQMLSYFCVLGSV